MLPSRTATRVPARADYSTGSTRKAALRGGLLFVCGGATERVPCVCHVKLRQGSFLPLTVILIILASIICSISASR